MPLPEIADFQTSHVHQKIVWPVVWMYITTWSQGVLHLIKPPIPIVIDTHEATGSLWKSTVATMRKQSGGRKKAGGDVASWCHTVISAVTCRDGLREAERRQKQSQTLNMLQWKQINS